MRLKFKLGKHGSTPTWDGVRNAPLKLKRNPKWGNWYWECIQNGIVYWWYIIEEVANA